MYLLSPLLSRLDLDALLSRSFRAAFARLSRVEVLLSRGVPHMNPNTKSLHGGFWCCSGVVKCLSGPTTFSTRASLKRFTKRSRCLAPEEAALGIIIDTYIVNALYIYNMYIHTLICIHISTLYNHDRYVYVYISCIMLARTR